MKESFSCSQKVYVISRKRTHVRDVGDLDDKEVMCREQILLLAT